MPSRCSLMGFDLNRHWLDPSPWAHPTLHGVKQLIVQMYNDPVSNWPPSSGLMWESIVLHWVSPLGATDEMSRVETREGLVLLISCLHWTDPGAFPNPSRRFGFSCGYLVRWRKYAEQIRVHQGSLVTSKTEITRREIRVPHITEDYRLASSTCREYVISVKFHGFYH